MVVWHLASFGHLMDFQGGVKCMSGDHIPRLMISSDQLIMHVMNVWFLLDISVIRLARSMVVKFVKISSKSTTEAVREKSTRTFSKKYVFHHQEADFKLKNHTC